MTAVLRLLPLDDTVASRAVFVIVSGSDGRAGKCMYGQAAPLQIVSPHFFVCRAAADCHRYCANRKSEITSYYISIQSFAPYICHRSHLIYLNNLHESRLWGLPVKTGNDVISYFRPVADRVNVSILIYIRVAIFR